MDSLDSFDNIDDDYEMFVDATPRYNGGPLMNRSNTQHTNPFVSQQQGAFKATMQQRHRAATLPKPVLASKPIKHFYQNQMFLKQNGTQMNMHLENEEDDIIYEGMN